MHTDSQNNHAKPEPDLANQVLVVYHAPPGEEGDCWTPVHGTVDIPDGWEFLHRGNAFITRRVKQGPHWVLKGKYNRRGGYTPVIGVFAPSSTIEAAQAASVATAAKRRDQRKRSQVLRDRANEKYKEEFRKACLKFLRFATRYSNLAEEIAGETAAWACEKHSGRVGRTSLKSMEEKVALAVRAYIRLGAA